VGSAAVAVGSAAVAVGSMAVGSIYVDEDKETAVFDAFILRVATLTLAGDAADACGRAQKITPSTGQGVGDINLAR
jgi:hypothetical protein